MHNSVEALARQRRRLLTALILCALVMVALCVGGGVAVSGVLQYREQVTSLDATLQEQQSTIADLQSRLDETEQQLEQAQAGQQAAEQRLQELEEERRRLQEELDAAKAAAEEAKAAPMAGITDTVYPPGTKLVALTFDDGPSAKTTPRLLDELKKRQVPATFFVIGRNAARYPEILERMAAEGHVVANHTYSHPAMLSLSADKVQEEIVSCNTLIQKTTGQVPVLLRLPGGNGNDRILQQAQELGMSVIRWSVDTRDWEQRDAAAIVQTAFQKTAYGIQDGSIVLMHDIYDSTVDAAVTIMDRLLAEGYTLVTVPELLRVRQGGVQPGVQYYSADRIATTL